MATNVELLRDIKRITGSSILTELNQGSTFPFLVSSLGIPRANACVIYNIDSVTDLIVEFDRVDNTPLRITIPAGATWYDYVGDYEEFTIISASTTFIVHIKQGVI